MIVKVILAIAMLAKWDQQFSNFCSLVTVAMVCLINTMDGCGIWD